MSVEYPLLRLVSDFCLDGAALGCAYLVVASVVVLRFPRARKRPLQSAAPVTILKPLHGSEPDLPQRLASFCRQDYGAPVQIVCGVSDCSDAAVQAVDIARRQNPATPMTLIAESSQCGSNRKISNLANMLPAASHDVLVISDSDIDVGPHYLVNVVSELQAPDVDGVTCLYHGVAGMGRWSDQAALAINSHFLPNAVVGLTFRLAKPCFGSTIAMRRSTLSRLGGFRAFSDCLADDFAIGEALRLHGAVVAIPPFSVGHVCFHDSLKSLFAHELRTARTIRSIDPIGHAGTILTHPFPLALAAALLGAGDAMSLLAFALCCRIVLCRAVEHAFAVPRQRYWQIPVCDLLSFGVFVASFFGGTITWRGHSYRVGADGKLAADQNSVGP
ncbi:MAG TPA: bacteriohopanetetrol glucosamine biosynthesis glycosyltransferase HpnI [Pseudolabrys sp.]|nr:bacteriohopanetetrol glucosamine biosynthesis glycosyltransferase HpnI [Pseudolabrys sp.]